MTCEEIIAEIDALILDKLSGATSIDDFESKSIGDFSISRGTSFDTLSKLRAFYYNICQNEDPYMDQSPVFVAYR